MPRRLNLPLSTDQGERLIETARGPKPLRAVRRQWYEPCAGCGDDSAPDLPEPPADAPFDRRSAVEWLSALVDEAHPWTARQADVDAAGARLMRREPTGFVALHAVQAVPDKPARKPFRRTVEDLLNAPWPDGPPWPPNVAT